MIKNPPTSAGDVGSYAWVGKIPWSKKWKPTPVFLAGKFHGQWSLGDCSPWGCKESDIAGQLCACRQS